MKRKTYVNVNFDNDEVNELEDVFPAEGVALVPMIKEMVLAHVRAITDEAATVWKDKENAATLRQAKEDRAALRAAYRSNPNYKKAKDR